MDVIVNGETETCTEAASVADLLQTRGHDPKTVVVEHNGTLSPPTLSRPRNCTAATCSKLCSLWAAARTAFSFPAGGTVRWERLKPFFPFPTSEHPDGERYE